MKAVITRVAGITMKCPVSEDVVTNIEALNESETRRLRLILTEVRKPFAHMLGDLYSKVYTDEVSGFAIWPESVENEIKTTEKLDEEATLQALRDFFKEVK